MKNFFILFFSFLVLHSQLFSQSVTQTIRGNVIDKESNTPLEGAIVTVFRDSTLLNGANTDEKGAFRIEKIPVGRVNVMVSYLGYKKILMPNVLLSSGKEMVISFEMESSIETKSEVVVTGKKRGESINEMAMLSAHTFTVEETDRYAGSRGDPARMASNFAGVSGTDASKNDLGIRGNSPFGIVYRVDNVMIPNPNHFAIAGSSGGSVAILNNRMLSNSDFLTGAFPAEFGNACAGAFDIKMKNGNNERHEYTAQLGILGAEIFGEGPLSKTNKSSYVFNARYATLEGLVKLGVDLGTTAIPKYQDVQFKFNFPLKNGDNISFFGIGGASQIDFLTSHDKKPGMADIYATPDQDEYFRAGVGVLGLTYTHRDNDHEYSKFSFGASTQFNGDNFYRVKRDTLPNGDYHLDTMYHKLRYTMMNNRYTFSFMRNNKLSARSALRYGITAEMYQPYLRDSNLLESSYNPGMLQDQWQIRLNTTKAFPVLFQPYVQWRYTISEKVSTVLGVHGQYFTLNNSWSIEPRFSIKYQFTPSHSLAFAAGMHSQMLPVYQYFIQDSTGNQYNKNLDFSRSFHAILGYDVFFKKDVRIKIEAYYQQLWNLPVDIAPSSYNLMDEGGGFDRFFPGKLMNKGLGRNMGIEFTLEKFFTHNWFIMFSSSLYDSKLQGSDGKWYNSAYNGQYNINLLGTKEFKWGKKRLNTIGIGGKVTLGGGLRYTPYDSVLSALHQDNPVVMNSERNKQQFSPYFRFDIKLNYRCNTKRFTHEVGIDIVNVTGQQNVLRYEYISPSEPDRKLYQLGFLPLFYYRLDFWLGKKNW